MLSLGNLIAMALIPVKIPTKKYLRDFLASYFQNQNVTFDKSNPDYLFIRSLLEKEPMKLKVDQDHVSIIISVSPKTGKTERKAKLTKKESFFDSHISLLVPEYIYEQKLTHVSESSAWRFYYKYHEIFKKHFCSYVDQHKHVGKTIDALIREFCARHGWTEEDINIDTLKKLYQRHGSSKKKIKHEIIQQDTAPVLALSFL